MDRALVIGGTSAIGLATAQRLVAAGWRVDLGGRREERMPVAAAAIGARFVQCERSDPSDLARAVGAGADLLVDCVCYTAAQARLIVPLLGDVTSTAMLSSKAVYVDDEGNHSNSARAPRFPVPITEAQPTLQPGDMPYDSRDGYGPNKVAAEQVLLESGHPVTVIRPSKVHGACATRPREWMFVQRVLDRRSVVVLARRGVGVDHPTAAANIASLLETIAAHPGSRVLNCADPDAPSALEIARVVAAHLGHHWREVLIDAPVGNVGRHAWDTAHPIVLDMSAAVSLGYRPAGTYGETVTAEIDWLVERASRRASEPVLDPGEDAFFGPLLDAAAEDAYLEALARRTTTADAPTT